MGNQHRIYMGSVSLVELEDQLKRNAENFYPHGKWRLIERPSEANGFHATYEEESEKKGFSLEELGGFALDYARGGNALEIERPTYVLNELQRFLEYVKQNGQV